MTMGKATGTGTPPATTPARSPIEQQAQDLMNEGDEGNIDNVFDVMEDLIQIEEQLPAGSPLRPPWNEFYASMMEIAAGGGE
jgi:hypothetical protein